MKKWRFSFWSFLLSVDCPQRIAKKNGSLDEGFLGMLFAASVGCVVLRNFRTKPARKAVPKSLETAVERAFSADSRVSVESSGRAERPDLTFRLTFMTIMAIYKA